MMPFSARNWRDLYAKGIKAAIAVCGSPASGKTSFIASSPFTTAKKSNVIRLEEVQLEATGGAINRRNVKALLKRSENTEDANLLFDIWYCISCLNVRASENDMRLLKQFEVVSIPLVIILTKADQVNESEIRHLRKSLCQFESVFPCVSYSVKVPDKDAEMKLLGWIAKLFMAGTELTHNKS